MDTVPHTIPLSAVQAFVRRWFKVDPRDVHSVIFERGGVTVTAYRRDADGNYYVAGDAPAVEVVTLRLGDECEPVDHCFHEDSSCCHCGTTADG